MTPPAPPASPRAALVDEGGVFRTLFAAYPDALLVVDSAGTIVLANPSAAALLGYGVGELVGTKVDALVPDAIRPRHAEYRSAFGRNPHARPMGKQTELVARRKDGSDVVVEIALSPLQDHGNALVVAAIRDIGAYPRMKQALQRAHYSERPRAGRPARGRLARPAGRPRRSAASRRRGARLRRGDGLPARGERARAARREHGRHDAGRARRRPRRQPARHLARLRPRPGPLDHRSRLRPRDPLQGVARPTSTPA
jgi:PAS domain S-box-containing protein